MNYLGKKIHLKGYSQKGKNRIKQYGHDWIVLASTEYVLFKPNSPGPWLFVAPWGYDQEHRASRWIHGNDDPDFEIIDQE